MTEEDITRMARSIADTFCCRMCDENGETHGEELYVLSFEDIEEAVKLITTLVRSDEREACAKVCDDLERAKWESVNDILANGGRLAFAGPVQEDHQLKTPPPET